ncbi:MAG: aspartate--tRNA ligase [Bacteroidales bacterium]|nr:aspartate--tRNA ligase [Bacteroidales bacterium]
MYRTHTCGCLTLRDAGQTVTLAGWVQRMRDLGGMTFIDLRDRYGITQLTFNMETQPGLCAEARRLGREFVLQVTGTVCERSNKNPKIPTGDIEIHVTELRVLNAALVPPFTIEDDTDGGDELRMRYRYLDLRRAMVRKNIELRHRIAQETRRYLDDHQFLEIETPVLIKSTPEGARDFVVPSRMNPGQFYALPQSPQQYKQLLMVSGFDRYFQIVKCFRDEDLRADRQPEFTQIDCEMSFVEQDDVLQLFEGLIKHLFKKIKGIEFKEPFRRMPYSEAMSLYGSDKPDLRFDMKICDLTQLVKGKGFGIFDQAPYIGGICVPGAAAYSRKQTDELTDFVKSPQVGASGLVYVKWNADGTFKSSVDKFYTPDDLRHWMEVAGASAGDLMLVLSGPADRTRVQLGQLRLEMGNRLGLRSKDEFKPLWVVDFPLFEWDEETQRFYAMHHPFTSPRPEDIQYFETDPGRMAAAAYDCVMNGVELGGGSIRIHDADVQQKMFAALGFTPEQAEEQFGFLMHAFQYGAPPHGGIAFGFDRLVSMMAGLDSIRDTIAFPKNNAGRDVMSNSPAPLDASQLRELHIAVTE